ncbi:hypothetical protein BCL93_1192 [Onishia taeanensis]|uniref:Capsule polysaccharide biosynthesis protein n=1 Tax=Onishia taeanensis TaxID=284577 RepID=A0A328XKB9_9GAMM|nr:hypothetical protein [Halomonas taeanensis]RAR56800.1 hypothetical protein BCL93_1192 [Halomonas taeanensis]
MISYNKALYLCCVAEPWVSVAKKLKHEVGIEPVYFVFWSDQSDIFWNEFSGVCHLQTLENAWKGEGFPKNLKPSALDEDMLKEIAWYEINALKMMDRLDPLGNSFGFQERRYFFQDLVGSWLSYIEASGLDLVISPSIPHRVFDYALYVACRVKNIKFLMFQMLPFGSNSIIIDNIDYIGDKYNFNIGGGVDREECSSAVLNKISAVRADYDDAIPSYMIEHDKNSRISVKKCMDLTLKPLANIVLSMLGLKKPNTYWVEPGKMPCLSEYSYFSYYVTALKRAARVRGFKEKYSRLVSFDLPEKFILVALHYQPEETSCPTGGSYSDQISLVKVLDETLPPDVKIVVKEHKSQFYTHQESSSGRDDSFYDRIRSVSDRIFFASVDKSPFDLIDKAAATVTISGTIGWESAVRGTPALVFGRAWYEFMPRVYKVKNKSDIVMVWPSILEDKGKNLDREILAYHAKIQKFFIHAKHYKTFMSNDDVSMAASADNIAIGLKEFLL